MVSAWSFITWSVVVTLSTAQAQYDNVIHPTTAGAPPAGGGGYSSTGAPTSIGGASTTQAYSSGGGTGGTGSTGGSGGTGGTGVGGPSGSGTGGPTSGGSGGMTTGTSYGNIDANNEAYLRILTRGQGYYDSATHQINLLQGDNPNPGLYLGQIMRKDFANRRLILYATGQLLYTDGAACVAQAQTDFGAIATVISHENDTIPESNNNGGIMLEGEPYYHHTLQANAAAFNPLVRLGQANANVANPGYYLNIWITVAKGLDTYAAWLNSGNTDAATCNQMNKMLGHCFQIFLREPFQ